MTVYYDENDQDREFPITEADLKQEYELNCDLILGFEDEYPSFNAWL